MSEFDSLEASMDDFENCFGKRPASFFCPILLQESAGVDLIDGHILPQSLRTAARATVLQRKDVDNFFGHTIEPSLIEFLNSVTYDKAEFLERACDVTIVSEKGPLKLFVPSPKSSPPFPKIGLKDSKGSVIASPHVKGTLGDLGGASGTAEVRGMMSFHKPSTDGAWLKVAFLALFRLGGYRWATSAPGRFASEPLRQFFKSPGKPADAEQEFRDFASAVHVILPGTLPFDSLADSIVLLHDHVDDPRSVDPFAISCVFAVNGRSLLVTLPFCLNDKGFPKSLEEYRRLTADWNLPHRIVKATMGPSGFEPLSILRAKYVENPPPEMIPPSGTDSD